MTRKTDDEDNQDRPSWHALLANQISPIYVVTLIAAAAVTFSQVSELKSGFSELRREKESLALQISTINSQQQNLADSMKQRFDLISDAIDDNSTEIEEGMDETRQRLRSIEQALAKMASDPR